MKNYQETFSGNGVHILLKNNDRVIELLLSSKKCDLTKKTLIALTTLYHLTYTATRNDKELY